MAAVMFNLLGDAQAAEYFSRMSVASHGNERDYGHTGNFFCMTWAIPGVAQSGPNATGAWMHEFGAWYFDLARRWDGTYLYQGGEKMPRTEVYSGWDCTGAYLLAYAMPLKNLYLTGKGRNNVPQISTGKAQQLLDDGRGWTRKDQNSFYNKLSTEQLIERLSSWSPIVRERAASALGRRKDDVMNDLIDLLDAPDLYSQYGACQAIKMQKARGSAAVSALLKAYESDDVWLRILIGQALAGIGEPAKPAVPQLLARLAMPARENDPRNMEQRFLAASLFAKRGGLIGRSLEGIDRPSLLKAVRATLQNEDGRARSNVTTVYANLSDEEIKPLLPAILQAVVEPAPSGIMFADQIRMEGLRLLGKHRVKEGIEACVEYAQTQNHWASEKRTPQLMEILVGYGAHAKPMIPALKQLADRFAKGEGTFPRRLSLQKAEIVHQTIRTIEASDEYPKLIHLER
jgi:HEAT repeat protein